MRDNILETVGYLRLNKEGKIARHDGGTIVAVVNDVGWGEESPEIAAQIIATWNAKLQAMLKSSKPVPAADVATVEEDDECADDYEDRVARDLASVIDDMIAEDDATETPAQ